MKTLQEKISSLDDIKNEINEIFENKINFNLTEPGINFNLTEPGINLIEKIIEKNNLIRFDIFLHVFLIFLILTLAILKFKFNSLFYLKKFLKPKYTYDSKSMV